jgi:hypothetical protein
VEPVLKLLTDTVQEGIRQQFNHVMAKKNFNKNDVEAGREYVEAYVTFIHYVERIYEAVERPPEGHFPESEEPHEPMEPELDGFNERC